MLYFRLVCAVLAMTCLLPASAGAMGIVAVPLPGSLFVQWVPIASAASYQIEFRTTGGNAWNPAPASTTTACGVTVTDLTDGTSYEVRVTAKAIDTSTLDTAIATATPGADSVVLPDFARRPVALARHAGLARAYDIAAIRKFDARYAASRASR